MNRKTANLILAVFVAIVGFLVTRKPFQRVRDTPGHPPHAAERSETVFAVGPSGPSSASSMSPGFRDLGCDYFLDIIHKVHSGSLERPFVTLSWEGRVTTGALHWIGADIGMRPGVQRVFDAAFKRVEESMRERIRLIEAESDEETDISVYEIPADRDTAGRILQDVAAELAKLLGEDKAMVLMAGLDLSEQYSFFGMFDTRIEIKPSKNLSYERLSPDTAYNVQITIKDPETGKIQETSSSFFDSFRKSYGNILSLSERK